MRFLMAGGGTGGHVIPSIAVARELRAHGHQVWFVGTARGAEARLVPAAGFELERLVAGGIQGLGMLRKIASTGQLLRATAGQYRRFHKQRPDAVFSMGGYVAAPPVLAALLRRVPVVVMEPNAMPGLTNRWVGKRAARALLSFPEARRWFAPGRTEITGLPVREEFFHLQPKTEGTFTVLITGGSQGARTLNRAARECWPLLRHARTPVQLILQCGHAMHQELARDFAESGLEGRVTAFLDDMPAAFEAADLVICRSGAGAVSELAAAGKPSVLVPFPFATDNHQLRNAEAMRNGGAARLVLDREWTGESMRGIVTHYAANREELLAMAERARAMAHPKAARRAAEILQQIGSQTVDTGLNSRNNTV